MKLQHIAVIFVIIIVPITMVLSTYVNTQIKTIRYAAKYDAFLIDASYDALKAYQLNSFNNNVASLSNSKIRDIEASINVYFDTLASDFKSAGYTYEQMVSYTPAILFSLYDGYYIYTKNFDVEKDFESRNFTDYQKNAVDYRSSYEYGLKPFVFYSCRYKTDDGENDFVVNYTLDNRISVIGKVNNQNVTKSGPLIYVDNNLKTKIEALQNTGEKLSDNLLIVNRNEEDGTVESSLGLYEYVMYGNEKVYMDHDWLTGNPVLEEGVPKTKRDSQNSKLRNNLFFRYSSDYTKNYVSSSSDLDYLCQKVKNDGHIYCNSVWEYYNEGIQFTQWCNNNLAGIRAKDAVDVNGNKLSSDDADNYYCNFVTDLQDTPIFEIGPDNNPLVPSSAFNEHRISVIRYSIEENLSSAMASFVSESNVGYSFNMPVFTEDDWNKIENNVCISSFLQGMPVGSEVYNKYFVLSNNENKDAVDIDSLYVIATNDSGEIEYHKPGCLQLLGQIAEHGMNSCVIGIYQSSDFKRRTISITGDDVNAINQLNRTEGTNFHYYYLHSKMQTAGGGGQFVKGACYDCIVNVSSAISAEGLLSKSFYDYVDHVHRPLDEYINTSFAFPNAVNNVHEYLDYFQISLFRIRQNAFMNNGYFGI